MVSRMRSLHCSAYALLTLLLIGCGGADPSSLLSGDASVPIDVGVVPDVGPDTSATCPSTGACTDPNVPQGWTPVALTTSMQSPCPTDFGTADDVTMDPELGGSGCACSCTKTQDPDCQTGSSTWSGIGLTCASGAASLNFSAGNCRPTTGTVDDYDKATTLKASGGACTVAAVPNNGAVTSTPGRLCTPDATCAPAVCGGYAPTSFTACIVSDGSVACPAASAFSVQHVVTSQAQVQCSDCGTGCTFQGDCTTPELSFYSDNACGTLIVSIPANGVCTQTNHANAVVAGTRYTATSSFTGCTATGTSTASLDLQSPRTVCCRP